MLKDLSQQSRDAYERANECARKAKHASSEEIRQDYLSLERHWRDLARSYEGTQRLDTFTDEANRQQRVDGHSGATILPFLRAGHDAFDTEATRIMGEAFDAACEQLGGITDGDRETIAGRIIDETKRGERDPIRLREAGVEAVRPRRAPRN